VSNSTITPDTNPARKRSRAARFFAFPVTWMVIGIAVIVLVDSLFIQFGSGLGPVGEIVASLLGGLAAVTVHRVVMHRLAGRATPELAAAGALRQAALGCAIGAGFILTSIGVVALLGGFNIGWHPINPVTTVALAVGINLGAAAVEEIAFRGIAFQAIEQLGGARFGRWIALAVTALFFGAAHMLNPGATWWSGLAIAIEAGILLGAAFMWRRNLWFVIGIHFAWNVLEGLFGIAVSGHRDPGLFLTVTTGPAALTGGSFGVEASVVPVLISIAISVPMIIAAQRRSVFSTTSPGSPVLPQK
jgi:membrane protease YdiL (CAAX protease family)